MALDGMFLHTVVQELSVLLDGRVDRIFQPSREELMFGMRQRAGNRKLLLSSHPNHPRIHLTNCVPENPKNPPMFCMLLRKRLSGARLLAIRQQELDRVLFLDFATHTLLGDPQELTLAVELMGRQSNLVLIEDGRVVDAMKRVDTEHSKDRPIQPGAPYIAPPLQAKLSLLRADNQRIFQRLDSLEHLSLEQAILKTLQGVSPILARELALHGRFGLERELIRLRERLNGRQYAFTVVQQNEKPFDFSFVPILQYGSLCPRKSFDSPSKLLDYFYEERARVIRMKERSKQLSKSVGRIQNRLLRKLEIRRLEFTAAQGRGDYKLWADLLSANLYAFSPGLSEVLVENFYSPSQEKVVIPLDPNQTPAQNAQRYYKEYKRAQTAQQHLQSLIVEAKEELDYMETVLFALKTAENEVDLQELRRELIAQGYLYRSTCNPPKQLSSEPRTFASDDGFRILVGRNNLQNDWLTLKKAQRFDVWCHTQKIHGAHVIVQTEGKDVPDSTIRQACNIAACYSQASAGAQVPVDYTAVRYVKKPAGAQPGRVVYTRQRTVYLQPDHKEAERLFVMNHQGRKREV